MSGARAGGSLERASASVALAAGLAIVVYAALRTTERLFLPQANPALVLWSERSAFLWRFGVSGWLGGLGLFAGWALSARGPERAFAVAAVLGAAGPAWIGLLAWIAP